MTVWLRSTVTPYKWHAEQENRSWMTCCGRYVNPMFQPARVEAKVAPVDSFDVCLHCLRAMEMRERIVEKVEAEKAPRKGMVSP
jgi:hypothetical protein